VVSDFVTPPNTWRVTLSQKELQRIKVVENAVEGRISVAEAAELLQLSERHVKRLKRAYDAADAGWVHHGNQKRVPANAISEEVRNQVVELASGKYAGFNDSHLHEKLVKAEGLLLSRPSVRRILRGAGIRSPQKRRAPKYRSRRERRAQEGMLLQVDGSRHDWLEGRGPHLTLLGGVDDATNKVCAAHFQSEHEDSAGYLRLFRSHVETVGVPWAIYRDQHGTLQRNDKHWSLEEELAGKQFPTQVGRALEELGIEVIVARSPQAKGRIERTWRTFQDRLASELRLAKADNLEQADAVLIRFLAEYNERFGKPAARPAPVWRKLDRRLDLNYIFSLRYERTVGKDHIITAISGVPIQLPPLATGRGYAGKKVEACHQPNGDFHVYLDRRLLHIEPAGAEAGAVRAQPFRKRQAPHKKKPVRIYNYAGHPALRA
jgi:transposase